MRSKTNNVRYGGEVGKNKPKTEVVAEVGFEQVETVVNSPIPRYRDAKSGGYISAEEAEKRDAGTWILDTPFDKEGLLEEIYWALDNYRENDIISVMNVRKVFENFGLEFRLK